MEKTGKTLVIIPARGGSKGIPRKNIRLLLGKPLIAYAIELALKCRLVDKVIVSTDDEEIADIAKQYGAEVPFMRPEELATDKSPIIETLRHTVRYYEEKGVFFDNILLLEPTNPLREVKDVEETVKKINEPDVDTVVTVRKYEIDFSDVMVLQEDEFIKPFLNVDKLTYRRQDEKNLVLLNAAAYAVKRDVLMDPRVKMLNPYGENSFLRTKAVLMPAEMSIEIDSIEDLNYTEYILKQGGFKNESRDSKKKPKKI
jgi:CMP-N-acetylneuraminic acid synthetase